MVRNESQGKLEVGFSGGTRSTLQNQLSIFVGNGNMAGRRCHVLGLGRPRDHDPQADNWFFSGGLIFTIPNNIRCLVFNGKTKNGETEGTSEQTYVA